MYLTIWSYLHAATMISTLLFGVNLATAAVAAEPFVLKTRDLAPVQPPSLDVVTENFAVLSRSNIQSRSSQYLRLLRRGAVATATLAEFAGKELVVNIMLDGAEVPLIIDTGSSEVWVPAANFTCVGDDQKPQPESACKFGGYRFNGPPSGGYNPDVHIHVKYGANGIFGIGRAAYVDVSLAGIQVTHQQVGIINYTNWDGDGHTMGLAGLGYSFNTNAFSGPTTTNDGLSNHVVYDSLITTMSKTKGITSFSMAQPRGSPNAYIAFGGLPPVQFDNTFASTPVRTAEVLNPALKGQYVFYIVGIQGFVYTGASAAGKEYYALVDSGTTDVYLPSEVYNAILKLYQPPAMKIDGHQAQFAPCTATPPAFGVTLGGQTFQMSKETMFSKEQDPVDVKGTKYCAVSIRDGGNGGSGQPFVLGDAFLKNVVTVYDIGAAQIRFAALK